MKELDTISVIWVNIGPLQVNNNYLFIRISEGTYLWDCQLLANFFCVRNLIDAMLGHIWCSFTLLSDDKIIGVLITT